MCFYSRKFSDIASFVTNKKGDGSLRQPSPLCPVT